jgi:N-acyl-D-amino-acid deacylase
MLDLLIRDARVLDGSGNPWFRADVGVAEGRIAAIGRLASGPYQLSAHRVIDAGGRVLCPGFIDTHVHSELAFLTEPTLEPKVRQGITTEVLGQDGISVAPVSDITRPQFRQRLAGLLGRDTEWNWSSVADYLERVETARPSANACYLAPHGTIRAFVVGFDQRSVTAEELKAMQAQVARALADGAVGLSSGLIYPPCAYGDTAELEALCRVAGERGGAFVVHVRNEGDNIVEAMDEVIGLTFRAGIPLHVSHLKVVGTRNRHKLETVLERFEAARRGGHDVTFDQYPYVAGSSVLDSLLPPWVLDGGVSRMLERLRDPTMRRRIAAELEQPVMTL